MKVGFNMLLWTTHVTDDDLPLLEDIKKAGYDGVEIPIFEGDPAHFEKVGKAIKDNGLGCTSVTVIPDEEHNPVSADAGSCSAAATWTAPTAADNCPGVSQTSSHAPGSTFPVGTTTVTYTGTDTSGNTGTASFNVTVTDNTAPTISGMPADITLDPPPAECDTAVTWTDPTAADNCAVATFTSSHTSGSPLSVGTSTTVIYTATDINGNTTTASFTITVNDPDFDGDTIGDCTDPDIDNDGSLNADDSDDFNNSVCSDTDGDGCEDCAQGGENSYDPNNDGTDSDGDGICDENDNCSDPLANNYLDPANEECQVCPNAPLFNGISCTDAATTLSSADGAISLDLAGNPASTLYLWGINGAPDTTIALPDDLNDLEAGYYTAMVQDADGCWGVADTSVGGTTLQQPAIMREIIIPYDICCSGCGINDADADGLCDDSDNCTDQSACNFDDACNEPCVFPDGNGACSGYGNCGGSTGSAPATGDLLLISPTGSTAYLDSASNSVQPFSLPNYGGGATEVIQSQTGGYVFVAGGEYDGEIITVDATFDPSTGNFASPTPFMVASGLAYMGSSLMGVAHLGGGSPAILVDVNTVTGQLTSVGSTGIMAPVSGLEYNATANTFYAVSAGGVPSTLYHLDPATGAVTNSMAVSPATVLGGLRYANGTLYAGGQGGNLWTLDPNTGVLTSVETISGFGMISGMAIKQN